jgi:diguanylate cyclase (GGDEF)-like protein
MRDNSVILDNGTIREALIALGLWVPHQYNSHESVKVFDSFVASAELVIESILLRDKILIPDLHSPDYNAVGILQSKIGGGLIDSLPLNSTELDSVTKFAERDFSKWPLADAEVRRRLREFAGVEPSILSWDRWLMEYTYKFGGYYTWQAHKTELVDQFINRYGDVPENDELEVRLFVSLGYDPPSPEQYDAVVLWLAFRTCLYDAIAWIAGLPYTPHPLRASLWKAINYRRSEPDMFRQLPADVLLDARMAIGEHVNEAVGTQIYDLDLPPFLAYILSKAKSREEILPLTIALRENPQVIALRNLLQKMVENIFNKGGIKDLQRLQSQFGALSTQLKAEYHAGPAPRISPSIQVTSFLGVQFDIEIPTTMQNLLSRFNAIGKPHLAFLRDVFGAYANIWKLSDQYDKLFRGKTILSSIRPAKKEQQRTDRKSGAKKFLEVSGWSPDHQCWRKNDPDFIGPNECRQKLEDHLHNYPQELCQLALFDVDNLDSINEEFGHAAGDIVLIEVATILRDDSRFGLHPRYADLLSMAGGDTFIAVKFNTYTYDWIADFKKRISRLRFEERVTGIKKDIRVRVSSGVAISPTDGSSADQLLRVAYSRLMENKRKKKKDRAAQ